MDVLNKFCSTVSSTVSQLSNALPGNPVTREYEATNHIASAGTGLLWKIYSGYKKSTRQEAAIFVFDKKQVEKWPKTDRDLLLDTLKRGISQLTRLRHPQILVVHHPLEESRDSLAFATEPVFASLANVLGKTNNMPTAVNPQLKDYKLFEVEIKYGLLQIGEGLAFLHNDAKILHHNVCPESIVINQQGAWKIFGFDFCVLNTSPADGSPNWPFIEYRPELQWAAQPALDYLAPECGLAMVQSPASDMYSLGVLICALYNNGQPLLVCDNDWYTYKKNMLELKQLSEGRFQCIAEGLRVLVRMMLNFTPEIRPDEHEFIKTEFFEDVGVKTLNYLDSLFQWDNLQKSQFYKGLPQVIDKLPHRVCLYRVVPCLVKEFVNPTMVPFVLPNVLSIAEKCSKDEFVQHILPHLKPVMKIQDPIQVLLIFMQKMDFLLKLTPCEEVKNDVLPMFYRALESDAQQIQELCLTVLPNFAGLIEYPAMKNALLPRIKRLCISTSYISVRVNCLVCLGKLLEHLDKWLVLDEILPFLPQIPSREPAVLMGILGIYKLVLTHKKFNISKEVMATKILPFLMPLSIENALTLNQFNALIAVIKEMVNRVETEHRVKLEQLNSIQKEQKNMDVTGGHFPVSVASVSSDLGEMLDLQAAPNNAVPPKPVSIPTNSALSTTNSFSSDSLSITDKQRLVKEQDVVRRLQKEPVLNPCPAPVKAPPQPPKDLTSSLMENNLSQMTLTKQSSQIQPQWRPQNPTAAPQWPQQVTSSPSQPAMMQQWQQAPSLQWHSNTPVINNTAPSWQANGMTNSWNNPTMNQMQNMSSFNNKTMSMPPPLISSVNQNNNAFQQPVKQLSSSEINDLLS